MQYLFSAVQSVYINSSKETVFEMFLFFLEITMMDSFIIKKVSKKCIKVLLKTSKRTP